jgi:hypothetical protein
MGRPERPLDKTTGPIAVFAHDLRLLRTRAGNPSYRELARKALFAPSVLSSAASGHRLPTLAVTLAFVSACGGDRVEWERRWRGIAGQPMSPRKEPVPPGMVNPAPHLARPAQLPLGSGTFVGRTRTLAEAVRLIGSPGEMTMPLVVNGPVGAGKTAFAVRLAEKVAAHFPDGQLYADLGETGAGDSQSVNSVLRGFLRALGVPVHLVPDDPAQRLGLYRSLLAQHRIFVLLAKVRDEHQVRPLLVRTAHSQVVVTSRARLLGLDGAHRVELDTFTREESMTLIGRLAGPARVRAEYEAADTVAELCGDLPLAVNIAGRRIAARQDWTIAYTARQLADRDRMLSSLSVGDVAVRDRFDSAYRLLSPAGRQALRHLACDDVGWTTAIRAAAAMGVATETADGLLESLVDAGLLRRSTVAGRYSVSRLVSLFAADIGMDRVLSPLALSDLRARRTVISQLRRDAGWLVSGSTSDIH